MAAARRSALFFVPIWPEVTGSAAGVRTDRLVRAFRDWGFRVAVACAVPPGNRTDPKRLEAYGTKTIVLPLNDADALRGALEATEPDVAIFDRFYSEEQFSTGVRKLRPSTLRILDMQDSHALRLSRQRCVLNEGGSIVAATRAFPTAFDATHSREVAAILRSDLTFACSPVELTWLRDECNVPATKLALAPLFYDADGADSRTPAFGVRTGFLSLGTFRHPPNVDATHFLVRDVWPRVRAALPAAQLSLIGSHPTKEVMALHAPHDGVHVKGYVSNERLRKLLRLSRVLIAPLRFGAGLKGKVLEAWSHGTPVVTTPIGAEGMVDPHGARYNPHYGLNHHDHCDVDDVPAWGGLHRATDAPGIAADAVRLHSDRSLWASCRGVARRLCTTLFDETRVLDELRMVVQIALAQITERRRSDYCGAALWHHRQRSTELLAKYIELKEATRGSETRSK